eukprot:1895026-Amphidinium_carterae.2
MAMSMPVPLAWQVDWVCSSEKRITMLLKALRPPEPCKGQGHQLPQKTPTTSYLRQSMLSLQGQCGRFGGS